MSTMSRNCTVLAALFCVNLIFMVLGGVVFHLLEREGEREVRREANYFTANLLGNFSCLHRADIDEIASLIIAAYDKGVIMRDNSTEGSNWDVTSAIFFAGTISTTIGYGFVTPTTIGGRIFCVAYAVVGIPVFLLFLSTAATMLSTTTASLARRLPLSKPRPKLGHLLALLVVFLSGLFVFIFLPAVVFSVLEEWDYAEALYYGVITLTTIGFGDYVAGLNDSRNRPVYRLGVLVWIIFGIAWLAALIACLQNILSSVLDAEVVAVEKRRGAKQNKCGSTTEELEMTSESRTL